MSDKIRDHFDEIAEKYDIYKSKNWFYYYNLKLLLKQLADCSEKSVIEVGCGTGDLLAFLNPAQGKGVDISKNMVLLARKKHPSFSFEVAAVEELFSDKVFDVILLVDVVEHLSDVKVAIGNICNIMHCDSKLIITMANPLWEPLLLLLEKLQLKMPEGPHTRISSKHFRKILRNHNLRIVSEGRRLLIPKDIFILSKLNDFFYKIPFLRSLGLIEWYVIEKG